MKRILKKINPYLKKLSEYIDRIPNELIVETDTSIDTPINDLAPKIISDPDELAKIMPYLNNLKQAIDSKSINNIAVTGSYGSGKSTILKTFQHHNPNYKYLNISLASFNTKNPPIAPQTTLNKDQIASNEQFERNLEISILQQMFYHVKPSTIPDSRFKRIVNISLGSILLHAFLIILWIVSSVLLFKFDYVETLNPQKWSTLKPFNFISFFSTVIFLLGIGFFIKSMIHFLMNSKISKINIKGELELGESIDKSVFNQHLEEILYFFERTNYDVVIIEDVDRFNSTDIFTKLREINILINNSILISRPVNFVYAIKDETFNDKNERVKFFEFIIPIISFINPSNASEQLSKLITNANLNDSLSKEFTSDIVTFIDDIDMRLLINIFQEYQVYKRVLSNVLNQDKLFAIIVYKNMFPDDFGELPKRRGKLYKILSSKNQYISELIEEINNDIESLDSEINIIENHEITSVKELRAIYINSIVSRLNSFIKFSLDGLDVSISEALEDIYFKRIIEGNGSYQYYSQGNYRLYTRDIPQTFSTIEKEISKELSYDKRESIIRGKLANRLTVLRNDREKLKGKISELESMSLQEVFEKIDVSQYLSDFNDSLLIRNLLTNGYIDEHYDDYISLFHEVNITKDDFTFERKVKSAMKSDFNYSLTRKENLIKRIPDKYYKREAILNYDLISYLLDNENRYHNQLENILTYLSIDDDTQSEFIIGYIQLNTNQLQKFIKFICSYKPTFWKIISNHEGLNDTEVYDIIKLIFNYSDKESIVKFSENVSLVKYFQQMENFFDFCSTLETTKNIKDFFSVKSIMIKSLDLPKAEQQSLFDFIYENNHYSLNFNNVVTIVSVFDIEAIKTIRNSHFTTLLKLNIPILLSRISSFIKSYVSDTILKIEENIEESEETLIDLLNRKEISLENKNLLIKQQLCNINSFDDIGDTEVKKLLLTNNKLAVNWENIINYYYSLENQELDEELINFLDNANNYETLSELTIDSDDVEKYKPEEEEEEQGNNDFVHSLILCNSLTINSYKNLLNSINQSFVGIEHEKLDTDKLVELIISKTLTLSDYNYKGLKKVDKNLSLLLIEVNQDEFLKSHENLSLQNLDWINLFRSRKVRDDNKISLFAQIDENILLNNNFILKEVLAIFPIEDCIPLSFTLLKALFSVDGYVTKKVDLLNLYFDTLSTIQVKSLLEGMENDYSNTIKFKKKPSFKDTQQNLELFENLKKARLISSYNIKQNKIQVIALYS